jgi:hypothetical protein
MDGEDRSNDAPRFLVSGWSVDFRACVCTWLSLSGRGVCV